MLFTLVDRFAATGFTDMMTSAEHSKGAVLKVRNHTSTFIKQIQGLIKQFLANVSF